MTWKTKIILAIVVLAVGFGSLFIFYPRIPSLVFSFKKECRVMRVEQFMKGISLGTSTQMNKISVVCEDGYVCRASDTGFSAVRTGDVIEFRGFPEFSSIEEWGKCENAQLLRIISSSSQ